MRKLLICKKILYILFISLVIFGSCRKEEEGFLPEAENDYMFTVIGE